MGRKTLANFWGYRIENVVANPGERTKFPEESAIIGRMRLASKSSQVGQAITRRERKRNEMMLRAAQSLDNELPLHMSASILNTTLPSKEEAAWSIDGSDYFGGVSAITL